MFMSKLLSFFSVYLFKDLNGLFVAFFNVAHGNVLVIELGDIDIVKVLTAGESIFPYILGLETDPELCQILAAVESPAAYCLYGVGDIDRAE